MSHNPNPFFRITRENMDRELLKFVQSIVTQTVTHQQQNRPAILFVKYELATKRSAENFLKRVMKCIQLTTKHIFKHTLHVSQLTTPTTTENQLDLIIGVGINAEEFEKVLRHIIISTNNKDAVGVPPQEENDQGSETASTAADAGGTPTEDTEGV